MLYFKIVAVASYQSTKVATDEEMELRFVAAEVGLIV